MSLAHRPLAARPCPFRQYFYIDSEHHLIDNGIVTSARDTFNAVDISYVYRATDVFPSKMSDPSAFYTDANKKFKCNELLREDFCRYFSTRERNCEGGLWASRYAFSYLFRSLKDLYQGEIVITGEPALKPYDQIFSMTATTTWPGPSRWSR